MNLQPSSCLILDGQPLTLDQLEAVSLYSLPVAVAPESTMRMTQSRSLI